MALWKISQNILAALVAVAISLSFVSSAAAAGGATCSSAYFFNWHDTKPSGNVLEDQEKWFKITTDQKAKLTISLDGPNSPSVDLDLYVYKACSPDWTTYICRSATYGSDETCTIDNAATGNYYFKVKGFNNGGDFTVSAKLSQGNVDLYAIPFSKAPEDITDKDTLTIEYFVKNTGTDNLNLPFIASLYVDDLKIDECTIITLKAGLVAKCTKDNLKLSAGTRTLKFKADSDNQILELDESNNEKSQTIQVKPVTSYDLQIDNILTNPGGELNDWMLFFVSAEVKNFGPDDINSPFDVLVSIDDNAFHTCRINSLRAGISDTCTFPSSQKWSAGRHSVFAWADSGKVITETKDDNNQLTKYFDVIHVPEVDLTIPRIYTIPETVDERTPFELRVEVKNAGPESLLKPFKAKIYVNDQDKFTCNLVGAIAGLTTTCSYKDQKWPAGSYKIKAIADPDKEVPENSRSNNALEKTIEITKYCTIKDGSAADCECNFNPDCPSGYFCQFSKTGYDACQPVTCKDECATAGFYCQNGDVYECGNFDDDPCADRKIKDVCGFGTGCVAGKSACQGVASPIKMWAEDAGSHAITVYKQPGDLVEITISSSAKQDITVSSPPNFILENGDCKAKLPLQGEAKCLFRIDEEAQAGSYLFSANERSAEVYVTTSPKTITLTDKGKLSERFPSDKAGVKGLLEKAFSQAHSQKNSVIYYLDREMPEHPFSSYELYNEGLSSPSMTDNLYSLSVAEFANSKCGECSNIIILGDDFVVPFYRVDYAYIHNFWKIWVENKTGTRYVYTDQPYIKEKKKTMGDLASLFDKSQHKEVKLVVPNSISPGIQGEIDKIKEAIKAFSYSDSDIKQVKSSEIGCNSYSTLDKATLILIGTRDDNNAIKCVPWFDIGSKPTDTFKASIEIERNVWANNEYAIIVSGKDVHSGLENLHVILNNPEYFAGTALGQKDTVYIHDFSNPPEMPPGLKEIGSHIVGFALGTCDEGKFVGEKGACIATDMVAGVVPPTDIITDIRDVVLYCPSFFWNKITMKKASGWDGLACGGSAAGTGITVGKYVTAVTGVGAVAGTVADGGSTALKTVLKVTKSSLKGGADRMIRVLDKIELFKFDNAWKFFKGSDKSSLFDNVGRFTKVTSENSRYINKLTEFFPEDALAAAIKNVDDYEDVVGGTKIVMSNFKGGLEEFENAVKVCNSPCRVPTKIEAADFVKNIGRLLKNSVESISDFVTKQSSNVDDLAVKIKNGDFGEDAMKSFEGSAVGQLARGRAQNAASVINIRKATGGELVKTEQEVFDKLAKVGKGGMKPGADNVIKIGGKKVGVAVRTPKSVSASKIGDDIKDAANELKASGDETDFWSDGVLHIQVRSVDYENALKFSEDYLDNPTNLKFIEALYGGSGKFRVWVSKVEDYLVK